MVEPLKFGQNGVKIHQQTFTGDWITQYGTPAVIVPGYVMLIMNLWQVIVITINVYGEVVN